MDDEHLPGRLAEAFSPAEQGFTVGMGGQAAHGVDLGADAHILAEQADRLLALNKAATERPASLVAGDEHRARTPAEVVEEVMADPAGIAHAAGRDDDQPRTHVVERHRLLRCLGESQAGQAGTGLLPLHKFPGRLVEERRVLLGDAGRLRGHGRVHDDVQGGDAPLARQPMKVVDDLLRATHCECRDDDVAPGEGLLDDAGKFAARGFLVLVRPVAVGRFNEQQVGVFDRRGVAQDGSAGLSQVAAEDDLGGSAALRNPDLDDGRTKNVPGIAEQTHHLRMGLHALVVGGGADLPQSLLGIRHPIDGRFFGAQRLALLGAPPRGPLGIGLLDVGAVAQHHLQQVARGRHRVDRPFKAVAGQLGQQATVVDMCVGEEDEIDGGGIEGKGGVVACRGLASALDHAAIDQEADLISFDEIAGARDLAGCADKMDLHVGDLLRRALPGITGRSQRLEEWLASAPVGRKRRSLPARRRWAGTAEAARRAK